MNHFERFYATVERKKVDRPASWLGLPDSKAIPALYSFFGVDNMKDLKEIIDDDIYPVEMPYNSPTSNAIYTAFDFAKSKHTLDERTLTVPGFFEDYKDPSKINDFDWPDPSKCIDKEECKRVVSEAPSNYPLMGIIWSAHFQDACSAFGMEMALMKMLTEPDIFRAVIERIVDFYLAANEIFYEATKGKIHKFLWHRNLLPLGG